MNERMRVELIRRGSDVPEARRDFLLERIQFVISTNWQSSKPHWSREHSPFHDDFGLTLCWNEDEIVGYFIYKKLALNGVPVFYGAGTAVLATHHGEGCYPLMYGTALDAEWEAMEPAVKEIYFAWRTRSASIWLSCARVCSRVAPSFLSGKEDAAMQDICLRLAQHLYPGCLIEQPNMVMRGVYEHLVELRQVERPSRAARRFAELLADPADAIFSVGVVERSNGSGRSRPGLGAAWARFARKGSLPIIWLR